MGIKRGEGWRGKRGMEKERLGEGRKGSRESASERICREGETVYLRISPESSQVDLSCRHRTYRIHLM